MGRTSKKTEAGGSVKGQTSLISFFSKKPPSGQSKLFTQVLPGSRAPPTCPPTFSSPPLCVEITDDDADFQPGKKWKPSTAPNKQGRFQLAQPARQRQNKDIDVTIGKHDHSRKKHHGSNTAGGLVEVAVDLDSSSPMSGKPGAGAKTDGRGERLPIPGSDDCDAEELSDFISSASASSSTKSVQSGRRLACGTPKVQTNGYRGNDRRDAVPESQGSPITVIPETPEIDLNSGKTKRRIDNLTPTNTFRAFVPETPPSVGHQSSECTSESAKKSRHERTPKMGSMSRRGGANRRGRDLGRITQRDKFSSSIKLPETVTESPRLLEEMLEEFAQSEKSMSTKSLVSVLKPPHKGLVEALGRRSKTSCSPSNAEPELMASVYVGSANISPAKAQPVSAERRNNHRDCPEKTLTSSPSGRCDLEDDSIQEIDPLEEMLQEYAASSPPRVESAEHKISAQPGKNLTLGDRLMVNAKRPSSKLSRTLRIKKHQTPRSGLSPLNIPKINPASDGNWQLAAKDTLCPDAVDPLCNNLDQMPTFNPVDEEDLLDPGTMAKPANPFVLKPSAIKLKASAFHKTGSGQSKLARLKTKHNMRKRSPCKGNSPYAKRHSASHGAGSFDLGEATDINSPLSSDKKSPQSLFKEMLHVGSAAKKSLFPDEKENLSADFRMAEERSPPSPDASLRSLADQTNVCNLRAGSPSKQDKNLLPFESSHKISRGFEARGTAMPEAGSEGQHGPVTPQSDGSLSAHSSLTKSSQESDELWEGELNDSLLAAMDMDMECLGTDANFKAKRDSEASEIVRDLNLLSPFKTASQNKKEMPLPADLNRYRVTAIQDLGSEKVLQLHCLTEHRHKACSLKGIWSNTFVEEGDTIAVHGRFDSSGMCTVDQQNNFLVVHPDLLLTGTNIARSIRCMRRSVLSEKFKGMDGASKPMLLGTILHDVFDKAIEGQNFSDDRLLNIVGKVSHQLRYLTDMYAIGMTEKNVLDEAQEYVGTMKQWADRYLQPNPKQSSSIHIKMPGQQQSEKCNVCIPRVKEIEETVWSPRWGTKGKVDLTVEVKIHPARGKKSQMTVPLELKTGRQTNSIEHRSQLVLYSLMLGDIQGEPASDLGLLLYLKTGAMLAVPANHMDKRELVHLRNQLAYYISLRAKLGAQGEWRLPRLPAPIEDDFTCGHCPHSVSCALLQRTDSEEGCSPHQLSEVGQRFFAEQISHLLPAHLDYFRHWYMLCALEGIATEKKNQTKHMWCTEAQDRELSHGGQCLSNLLMSGCRHNKTQDSYHVTFQRPPGHSGHSMLDFQVSKGDRVAVSVVGTRQVATCTGFIESISSTEVTIKSDRIMNVIKGATHGSVLLKFGPDLYLDSESTIVFKRFFNRPLHSSGNRVYRMDRDDAYNSMASSLVNLARLMHNDENAYRLRKLVVDLHDPEFGDEPKVLDSAKTKVADILRALNRDQRAAINAVLRSQDYTLIIGMPGTGKTTTIVALVCILCACDLSVLLTSYTHSAVDNILLKLIKFGISPLRLGEAHRVHPELGPYTTKEVLGRAGSVQQLASLFETKLVVATTCLGVKHALLTRRKFDVCIVDEASQVSQMVCLGPLFHARRFVLVGDHKQLPPLVQSSVARQLGMDESLFQRLGVRHESTPSATVQLSLQYRMNADIMALSNSLVYEGRLQCGNDEVATATLDLPKWEAFQLERLAGSEDASWELKALEPAASVSFLNTDKVRFPESADEKHTVNLGEALLVKRLVQCLIKCGCTARQIGIISPFRNQCKLLATMLDEHIDVNTVDKYQGRDKEVIIVSFATKDRQAETGFLLQDIRRLNVALTRAKHKLILIGCIRALRRNGPMEDLLDCLQSANLIATLPSDACSACKTSLDDT